MWSFLARLRERKLAHWAIAYLAGAWLLLQILDLLAHPFAWPDLVLQAATVLLGIGFLAMLVLAWYHGEKGAQRVSGVELLMLAGILVIAGAAVAFVGGAGRGEVAPTASSDSAAPSHARTAIAVLPFENLGANGPYAYFAAGLHDELLTQLSKVAALSVRGRTSVMGYAGTGKQIRTIADELSVGTIVEGSVQVVGERLRVNVQLIDAATDEHLWAERYDRDLDDAFGVQSEIAQQIVAAVGAVFGGGERLAIIAAPTANAEAYRLYLQGRDYHHRPGYQRSNLEAAQELYERALALDSTFALAWASLSEVHGAMSWFRYDPAPVRLEHQWDNAARSLRLAPSLPEARIAMGQAHARRRDLHAALQQYRIALQGMPNDAALWARVGFTNRQLGNWDEAFAALDRVMALDPRNADVFADLGGNTHSFLRHYDEAVQWYSRALVLAPDYSYADALRGWTWLVWQGHLDSLGVALARHSDAGLDVWRTLPVFRLYWERKPDSLLALLRGRSRPVVEDQTSYLPTSLFAAWAYRLRGDSTAARLMFDSARVVLDTAVAELPDDWRVHAARGMALAGLGRLREARREAHWLQQCSMFREPYFGSAPAENRAMILAASGEVEAALSEIERLLAGPADMSVHTLRIDPRWDPIRNNPRFQALLVKYARPRPVN